MYRLINTTIKVFRHYRNVFTLQFLNQQHHQQAGIKQVRGQSTQTADGKDPHREEEEKQEVSGSVSSCLTGVGGLSLHPVFETLAE